MQDNNILFAICLPRYSTNKGEINNGTRLRDDMDISVGLGKRSRTGDSARTVKRSYPKWNAAQSPDPYTRKLLRLPVSEILTPGATQADSFGDGRPGRSSEAMTDNIVDAVCRTEATIEQCTANKKSFM